MTRNITTQMIDLTHATFYENVLGAKSAFPVPDGYEPIGKVKAGDYDRTGDCYIIYKRGDDALFAEYAGEHANAQIPIRPCILSDQVMIDLGLNTMATAYTPEQQREDLIAEVKALDGKVFAMLTPEEEETLNFFRLQGRKYGVEVSIINEADSEELARAASQAHADEIMKRANSRVSVTVANS